MADQTIPEIYLLHLWIRQISPMIGRRLLVRSDSTLAALHDTIQIAFGWTDSHLHRFRIHGRNFRYGNDSCRTGPLTLGPTPPRW